MALIEREGRFDEGVSFKIVFDDTTMRIDSIYLQNNGDKKLTFKMLSPIRGNIV